MTEDEMIGWHHRLRGHEFGWGTRHIRGLIRAAEEGFGACILFVIQMSDVKYIRPHDERDPAFGQALRDAAAAGVQVLAMDCAVTPDTMELRLPVLVRL